MGRHDEEKLRRFLAARRAGDGEAARQWWDELVAGNFDRVRGMVAIESRGRLSPEEQDDAVQRALIKLLNNMIETFRGTSMGEWVESTRKLVKFACMDTQRRSMVFTRRERPLERRPAGEDEEVTMDAAVYAAIEKQRLDREADELAADGLREGSDFLDWALPRLSPKRRAVLELDRQGVPAEEIQRRLGLSRDVLYADRSRGTKDLVKLRDEYPVT